MTNQATLEVAVLVVCIITSALASGTETALTSVGRLRVRHLAEEGSPAAKVLHRLQQDPNRLLSTVLVANTVALTVASGVTTLLAIAYLPKSWGLAGDLVVSLLLSIFLLIFSEITPKTLAIRHAERVALVMARPVEAVADLLRPVLWFVSLVARLVTGGRALHGPYVTEQELMTILNVSEEQGVIEEEEREMMRGIIEIGDKLVREVMVPRTDIVAVDHDVSLEEVAELIKDHGHTRIPVYQGDLDHVIGQIHAKDILLLYARGERRLDVTKLLRPILPTPEQKKVDELLHEMQSRKVHMMVVVDEYGGTAGLVTLEDLIEEIVGEIRDEYDQAEEEPLKLLSESEAVVDGRYRMDELNDKLDLRIPESQEYDSVGGYVYSVLGTVPEAGATFEGGRASWTVEALSGHRVVRVRLTSEEPWPRDMLVGAGLIAEESEPAESGTT